MFVIPLSSIRKLVHNSYLQHYLSDVCLYVGMCRINKIDERFGIFERGGNDSLYTLFMTRVVVYKIQHTYLEEGASNETFYIYS